VHLLQFGGVPRDDGAKSSLEFDRGGLQASSAKPSSANLGLQMPNEIGSFPSYSPTPTVGTIILETVHLSRAVGEKTLVDDVSIKIVRGGVLAVVGPSGAGKSSFLRLLNRLDEPTGGEVLIQGVDYRSMSPRMLRRRVGMVMQSAFLFPGTVADNLAFGPRQCGRTLDAVAIAALLDQVGLPGFENTDVGVLSGGEAQRVSLARTLANDPEILALDEPTSALDAHSALSIEALLLRIIRERNMTCIIITHNQQQAARFADQTMRLEHGRLVAFGPTREVLDVE
jgi:putative ABC transport system ATP-binding protein